MSKPQTSYFVPKNDATVEAVQVTQENAGQIAAWIKSLSSVNDAGSTAEDEFDDSTVSGVWIENNEGHVLGAPIGGYVVRNADGSVGTASAESFERDYAAQ